MRRMFQGGLASADGATMTRALGSERREPCRVASLVLFEGDLLAARHFGQGFVNIRLRPCDAVARVKRESGQGFVNELTGCLFDRSKIAARYARFDLASWSGFSVIVMALHYHKGPDFAREPARLGRVRISAPAPSGSHTQVQRPRLTDQIMPERMMRAFLREDKPRGLVDAERGDEYVVGPQRDLGVAEFAGTP